MSEYINNREYRQQKLKELIISLHQGRNFEEVKAEFEKDFGSVSTKEISDLEQSLIMEGMPVAEVQRLCDVHSAVFKGSIDAIHGNIGIRNTEGHPINTFLRENRELKNLLSVKFPYHIDLLKDKDNDDHRSKLLKDLQLINQIEIHYLRKENLLFPYLEKYGIYGPAKVMWGVDDDIRDELKTLHINLQNNQESSDTIIAQSIKLKSSLDEMIFKEENILLPMAEDTLTQDEWLTIQEESDALGYAFISKPNKWDPPRLIDAFEKAMPKEIAEGNVSFETGVMSIKELELVLNKIPFDMTFIDKNDVVKYFSHGDRVFPRTKAVIGRTVQNCHPPTSVHVVNKMLEDFRKGTKDHEEFWIKMKGTFIYIRYFAIKDELNEYMGTLEVTQNATHILELEGEKRLLT
ncbi:MAG: domain S-box protein [Haloplasmataceae bacterium]|jgi:DUF438 domain-containing protein|nr:domain S-box protein [Haloplasmataceae bacterium]